MVTNDTPSSRGDTKGGSAHSTTLTAQSNQADTFVPPARKPQWPGYRWPDEVASVGELYRKGLDNPCGEWMVDLPPNHGTGYGRIECQLPYDHIDELHMPHISINWSKAWNGGFQTDLWFQDKGNDLVKKGRK